MWLQTEITLSPKSRGFHLVTDELMQAVQQSYPQLTELACGLMHIQLQHTSASITLNENADPDVRRDMETWFLEAVPDDHPGFVHTLEGPDDMPAHIKSSLLGSQLTLPIQNGRLRLGTWQGIWLGEHRHRGGSRRLVITIQGE